MDHHEELSIVHSELSLTISSLSIVCRAFQGVGGAGIFSMVPIIVVEMVEPQKYGAYNGFVSIAIALSFLLGPLLGGAITDGTTWRWIFWINLPVGAIALALILITMPAGFPDRAAMASPNLFGFFKKDFNIRNRVDYPGFFMLLTTCVLLVVAIEEAGTDYAWNSALALTCLVLAGVIFIAFITWQWYMDYSKSPREPVFPWQFVKNRVLMGMYLQAFLSGIPFVTFVIELPLRFISINGKSAFDSGVGVLPFTLGIGVSSGLAGMFLAKGRVPVIPQVLFASILQILGTGLLYSVPVTTHIPARIYGYQVLVGMGAGFSLTSLIMTVPAIVDRRVLAVGMGGVTQMRILGGALGTSIATNILNTTAKSRLATEISAETLSRILKDVSLVKTLSSADQLLVQAAFGEGFKRQLAMMLGFCAAEVIAVAMMMEWPLRRLQ
ncbi:hypothetical protein N7466_009315 [Penicillium verhagenii]|uniref:uncharacterized protein n=1 Tax=Penicillium verhagenii TaxID=1562060 RepID=UPI002544D5D2|nr:uncharacterized protein N7466_009315 [Penicillium verhagenii]KAJ5920989.1 hypothetical protein N7466_009315 [Penicillium verhagenii]